MSQRFLTPLRLAFAVIALASMPGYAHAHADHARRHGPADAATADHDQATTDTPPLEAVRGRSIKLSRQDLESALEEQRRRGVADTPELRERVRRQLVKNALLAAGARGAGLDRDPNIIATVRRVQQEVLAQAYLQRLADPHKVTEAEAMKEYERARATAEAHEFRLQRIQVADRVQADALAQRVRAGEAFEHLAAPGARSVTGEAEWVQGRSLSPAVSAEVERQRGTPGAMPEPVAANGAWHLVRVLEARAMPTPPFDQMADAMKARVAQARVDAWLRSRAKAEHVDY